MADTRTGDLDNVAAQEAEARPSDDAAAGAVAPATPDEAAAGGVPPEGEEERGPVFRPLLAAALTSAAAGLMAGGVFGSWIARIMSVVAAAAGVGWAGLTLRQKDARTTLLQGLVLPIAFLLGIITLLPDSSPSELPQLVNEAFSNGRLLRPPVPFDPGWRPILVALFFVLGFSAAWVAAALRRPQLALVLPLPVLALTAISQPDESEILAGILAFIPILGALAILYGGDLASASELTSQFELRRALRGGGLTLIAIVVLVGLSRSSFLFPQPVYNPAERPQKPKAIPLSKVEDKVLFEVEAEDFTGPWRTGILDVYDGVSWRLPPFDEARYQGVPADGVVDKTRPSDITVKFTVRSLGASPTFPGVATPTSMRVLQPPGVAILFDPRTDTFRVPVGRVETGTVYEMTLPAYATVDQFKAARIDINADPERLEVPPPPPAVRDLLAKAPPNPWGKLDFLRGELFKVAVAVGAGQPKDIAPSKVQDIFAGSHEASPFELVAAEAMLARWAGVPSRIAFGFDGFNDEDGKKTIRPKNGSSWLEVHFEGLGWQPLIATPQQAKASLDTDPNARFDVNIEPSEDVAVEVYVPIELENIQLLYQRVRAWLVRALPWIILGATLYLSWPAAMRAIRRSRRRRWAAGFGPRERIAVEYAEFRDMAMDLNVGDPYDTPLEYLQKVQEDDEHEELAWLVARSMYGDLAHTVTDEDVLAAEELSTSLRRRLFRAQPFQSRMLAVLSRASLRMPYTTEVPSIPQLRIPRPRLQAGQRFVRAGRALRSAVPLGKKGRS